MFNHLTSCPTGLFDDEVGLRAEVCVAFPGAEVAIGALLDTALDVAVTEGAEVGVAEGVPVSVTPGVAEAVEDVAAAWTSVSEAVGNGSDGTVLVPVYPGQPGASVLGGARPPPQSSN
jgi:hypothetical protein